MSPKIVIEAAPCIYRLFMDEILAFKADGNYTIVYLTSGEEFTIARQLGQIEKVIEEQVSNRETSLARLGRSHIINFNHIFMVDLGHKHRLVLRSPDTKVKLTLEPPREALKSLYDNMKLL